MNPHHHLFLMTTRFPSRSLEWSWPRPCGLVGRGTWATRRLSGRCCPPHQRGKWMRAGHAKILVSCLARQEMACRMQRTCKTRESCYKRRAWNDGIDLPQASPKDDDLEDCPQCLD